MTYPEQGKLLDVHIKKDDTKQTKKAKKVIPIWRTFIFDNTGVLSGEIVPDLILGRSANRIGALVWLNTAPTGTAFNPLSFGWLGDSNSQVLNRSGGLLNQASWPIEIIGTEEVWFGQDPASTKPCQVSVVGFYEH